MPDQPQIEKPTRRKWHLPHGRWLVVTDLHGDGDLYRRYRDYFLREYNAGRVDGLILLGDLIHRSGGGADESLFMVQDVMRLQAEMGTAVIYVSGNHEPPHIYPFTLIKGSDNYTPPFEHALSKSGRRTEIVDLFKALPFYLTTAAGVTLAHAGAFAQAVDPQAVRQLEEWSHEALRTEAKQMLAGENLSGLRERFARLSGYSSYRQMAHTVIAAAPDDGRYDDLLIGHVAQTQPAFQLLWDALYLKNENTYGDLAYARHTAAFLQHISPPAVPQRVLVTGHIDTTDGCHLVNDYQLRLASGKHARPQNSARHLLLDASAPVDNPADLQPHLRSLPDRQN